jgi:hypothetical protein
MDCVVIKREIPAQNTTLTLVARTDYAAPVLALSRTVYEVKGDIEFRPAPNKTYVVKGVLEPNHGSVWLEEETCNADCPPGETSALVGDKIETSEPTKLGFFEK